LGKTGGIIAFVSNGGWLDGNSADGFRKSLEKEFTSIYVFNLIGNQRTSGELSRKEGGKIFGSGSRTPIAITLLVKNPDVKTKKAKIHYHDIGDYLNQKEKLKIIADFKTFANPQLPLKAIQPNIQGDWISLRNDNFGNYIPIASDKNYTQNSVGFFILNGPGVMTGRDNWICNFSKKEIERNTKRMIDFYNNQLQIMSTANQQNVNLEELINQDPKEISRSVNLKNDLFKNVRHSYKPNNFMIQSYRPFSKSLIYWDKSFIERPRISSKIFPNPQISNISIVVSGVGSTKEFSTLMTQHYVTGIFNQMTSTSHSITMKKTMLHKKECLMKIANKILFVEMPSVILF